MENWMLQSLYKRLRRDPDMVQEIWYLVESGKLKKNTPSPAVTLDLPSSCNKFNLMSVDRVQNLLLHIEPRLPADELEHTERLSLTRLLCVALNCSENCAVPAKNWKMLCDTVKEWYNFWGQRLATVTFRKVNAVSAEVVWENWGVYFLVKNADGTQYIKIQHATGIWAALEPPIAVETHSLVDIFCENAAKLAVTDTLAETAVTRIFHQQGIQVPERLKVNRVGEKPNLRMYAQSQRIPFAIEDATRLPAENEMAIVDGPAEQSPASSSPQPAGSPPPGHGGSDDQVNVADDNDI